MCVAAIHPIATLACCVPHTVWPLGRSFLLLLSIAERLSQKQDRQSDFGYDTKRGPVGASFLRFYFSSFATSASSASIIASSKEGWGRMVRSICSAVRWLTMASLIWLIMSLAC